MYSDSPLRLACRSGLILPFEPGVPREVPDGVIPEAKAAGCKFLSHTGVAAPPKEGLEPALQIAVDKGLYGAVLRVVESGSKEDFVKAGVFNGSPKVAAVTKFLPAGTKVTSAEVFNVWTKVMLDQGRLTFPDGEFFDGTLSTPAIDGVPLSIDIHQRAAKRRRAAKEAAE
jgi:hypothetical protein